MAWDDQELVPIGETYYPQWAIRKAKEVMSKYGGKLLNTVQAVILLDEADKRAVTAKPNEIGRGFAHYQGGYVTIKTRDT